MLIKSRSGRVPGTRHRLSGQRQFQCLELLFWIDVLKRASAASVTAFIPYFSYAKGDKKDYTRVPQIRARVCADAIEAAGVDRVVTLDLHAPQVQGSSKRLVDDLYAMPVLCDVIASKALPNLVVVAPELPDSPKKPGSGRSDWPPRWPSPTSDE